MSRKQELYLMLLAQGIVFIRNEQSHIRFASWWRVMPRRWRKTGRQCYEVAQLLHHLPHRLREEGFTDNDFWFLNGPVRAFFQRAEPKTSSLYGLFLSPVRQLFALVPENLRSHFEWSGPELPEIAPERRAMMHDFLFHAVEENKNIETLRNALATGADPNVRNDNGETPLMIAERLEKAEYVLALKEAGAKE